ncbi:MAG: sugar phosphate isomerase/epimerase family protein [Planctomycetota bacterium]|jgi:sugar phosphate isomerase/epimerase
MRPLEIGVCSWSINRTRPKEAVRAAAERHQVHVVHLGFFDEQTLGATSAEGVREAAGDAGVEISATFAAFPGEDYRTISTVAETGGYLPDERFSARLDFTRRVADLSAELGVPLLAIHVGTVPPNTSGDDYRKLAQRAGQVADMLAERNLCLLLETGREPAETLLGFIDAVGRGNVAVNFDPGNMVLYGVGDPIRAVTSLRGRITHVHLKDAIASHQPGADWGTEASLGAGEANVARVVSKLRATGYQGPLIVERTAGRGDPGDLAESIDYLRTLLE